VEFWIYVKCCCLCTSCCVHSCYKSYRQLCTNRSASKTTKAENIYGLWSNFGHNSPTGCARESSLSCVTVTSWWHHAARQSFKRQGARSLKLSQLVCVVEKTVFCSTPACPVPSVRSSSLPAHAQCNDRSTVCECVLTVQYDPCRCLLRPLHCALQARRLGEVALVQRRKRRVACAVGARHPQCLRSVLRTAQGARRWRVMTRAAVCAVVEIWQKPARRCSFSLLPGLHTKLCSTFCAPFRRKVSNTIRGSDKRPRLLFGDSLRSPPPPAA